MARTLGVGKQKKALWPRDTSAVNHMELKSFRSKNLFGMNSLFCTEIENEMSSHEVRVLLLRSRYHELLLLCTFT